MQELGALPGGAKQKEGIEPSRKLSAEESPMKGLRLVPPFFSLQPGPGLGLEAGREGGSLDVAAARVWMETPLVTQAIAAPRWPLFQMPGQGDDQSWAPHTPCPKMCQHG